MTRRSSMRGCHAGSVEGETGRTGGDGRLEESTADSEAERKTGSATDSTMGSGAGVFLGRPLRRFGAAESTGASSCDVIGVLGAGCETEAGSRGGPRRLATGEKEDGRAGAPLTARSTLIATSAAIGGTSVGSRGGVSLSTR